MKLFLRRPHKNTHPLFTKANCLTSYGRSMVEMLAVLAIVGILSIAALAGLRYALNKNQANTILYDVHLLAIHAADTPWAEIPSDFMPESGRTFELNRFDDGFEITALDISEDICTLLLKMNQPGMVHIYAGTEGETNCKSSQPVTFVFETGWSSSGDVPTDACTPNPCQNGGTCSNGICTCPNGYEGTTCTQEVPCAVPDSTACITYTVEHPDCTPFPVYQEAGTLCPGGVCNDVGDCVMCLQDSDCGENALCQSQICRCKASFYGTDTCTPCGLGAVSDIGATECTCDTANNYTGTWQPGQSNGCECASTDGCPCWDGTEGAETSTYAQSGQQICGGANSAYYCAYTVSETTGDLTGGKCEATTTNAKENIGVYGGKTFFRSASVMSWYAANAWCTANNGRQATYADLLYDGGCTYSLAETLQISGHWCKGYMSSTLDGRMNRWHWLNSGDDIYIISVFGSDVYKSAARNIEEEYALCVSN